MKVLLHVCCAPCAIHPVAVLREEGLTPTGFFYPHNIHPRTEMLRRREALETWAPAVDLKVIFTEDYDLEGFIRRVAFREAERCRICYHHRLRATARVARRGRFDAFTSTLLYSKMQSHELIRAAAATASREVGVPFLYRDFRGGWRAGIEASKALGLYRQQYCGCIYSENERYSGKGQKSG